MPLSSVQLMSPQTGQPDPLSSSFPDAVSIKIATESLEQMMHQGDACRDQGRSGHHLAAPLSDLSCLLQSLCHLWHRPHPRLTLKHQFTQLALQGV